MSEKTNIAQPKDIEPTPKSQLIEDIQKTADKAREKLEKSSNYKEWAQLNLDKEVMDKLYILARNSNAMLVYLFLVKHSDKRNAIMVSYTVMQEVLELSKSSLQRAIKYLKDHKFIHIMKSGTSNVYVLNPDITWKSWGSNVKYCEFPVSLVMSESEQPKGIIEDKVRDTRVQQVDLRIRDTVEFLSNNFDDNLNPIGEDLE